MDVEAPDNITQMRLIHYMASENAVGTWRAGNHTDVGCLTLLFQRDGEDGLEICPGRESHTDHAIGDTFHPLPAKTGPIVVNIGDMLSMTYSLSFLGHADNTQWRGLTIDSRQTSIVSEQRMLAKVPTAIRLHISTLEERTLSCKGP